MGGNDVAVVNAASSAVLLTGALVWILLVRVGRRRLLGLVTVAIGGLWLALSWVGLATLSEAVAQSAPPQAADPGQPCPSTAPVKRFNVSLINIPLFLNRFADVVPEGRMYILDANIAEARATFQDAANPNEPDDLIEPLVLRVNRGDCVEVSFTNRLNEPAPAFDRDASIFTLPGERLLAPGADTSAPRTFAPARTQPKVDFNPAAAPPASMHFTGLDYDVTGSDGTAVGNNPNSTAAAGQRVSYRLFAAREGEFLFQDGADLSSHTADAGNFIGSNAFGAFGAIVVEKPGTTWVDISTGEPIDSGLSAIIQDPKGPDFREHSLFMHDEVEAEPGILTRFCVGGATSECVKPTAAELARLRAGTLPGLGGGDADALIHGQIPVKLEWFAFNYRAEPGFNREEVGCPARDGVFAQPACVGEETSLSSWPFGDPGGGDLVMRNYRGEPMQIRLFHGAEKETHTFHWHVNRWPFDPQDEGGIAGISKPSTHTRTTNPIDVQAVSPGSHYPLIPEGGAGSAHGQTKASFGDVIFHCHLYPHFANGMWGLNRVHDVLETGVNSDGSPRTNPDGTPILPLEPLADFDYQPETAKTVDPPPDPNDDTPGFPFFVPGEFGVKAPKPPLGVPERAEGTPAEPTPLEINAADPDARLPGAFFRNPCKNDRGTPIPVTKRFDLAAIELGLTYSPDLQWTNPQARIYVLKSDKQAILDDPSRAEPFSPLLNVGDCVEYRLTNDLPDEYGGTVFDRLQETNEVSIHQHMVMFDVLTSDGAANGWNYDQGADPGQTITYRNFVQSDVRTNSFHDHFFPNIHQDAGLFGGASIHPAGCTFHDPESGDQVRTGTIVDVRCIPTRDFHNDNTDGQDYRNYSLFVEDHVPMFQPANPTDPNDDQFVTRFGVPIFPAKFPSSPDDNGVMGVNYRLEPFEARRDSDPANLFDSKTHGDPNTPMPRAFAGDLVKFRLFQLSMEESHAFNLHRWRWPFEPDESPGHSNIVQAQHIGMLEYFEARLKSLNEDTRNTRGLEQRDYLYNYGGADDWFLGAWGLLRVHGCDINGRDPDQPRLQPLPDNRLEACPEPKGQPVTRTPGNPCPAGAPTRSFDVEAINHDIVYNEAGEHDPNGVMYALAADVPAIRNGSKKPEPLVIRANKGDCVEVTLTNNLDPAKMKPHCFEALEPGQLGFDPPTAGATLPGCLQEPPRNEHNVPGFKPFPVSARASLHPNLVDYHIGSDGANVGFNVDSTVGPGQNILYRWYAAEETGLGVLEDRADVQNHLHHGLYGGLIIEPAGAKHLDPRDGSKLASGQDAVIEHSGKDFREFVVLMQSDLSLFQANGLPVPDSRGLDPAHEDEANDPEDQGEFSIGYRNEPWVHRIADNPDLSLVFSSRQHGDPATPLFRGFIGDPMRVRAAQASGDPRSTGFALHGHTWRRSPNDPESQLAAFQGQFNPAQTYNIHTTTPKVNGSDFYRADFLYRSGTLFRHLPGGQWGIIRLSNARTEGIDPIPLPDRPVKQIEQPRQDAYFWADCPSCTARVDERLDVGRFFFCCVADIDEVYRSALQFDLDDVPAGAAVTKAELVLTFDGTCVFAWNKPHCGGVDHRIDAHRMTQPWTTTSTTGDLGFHTTVLSSDTLPANPGTEPRQMRWDVTATVRGWVDSTHPNHGLLLKRDFEPPCCFRSSEPVGGPTFPSSRFTGEPTHRPRLEVTWSP